MTADYVIVGAGTAGCVMAARLSEEPDVSVILIEAGASDKKIEVTMPVGYPKLQKTKRDWQYYTQPQKHLNNRILFQPRGKMIGGTGSMNGMIYIRGNQLDFVEWESLGCKGWSFNDVLPYFLTSEDNLNFDNEFHKRGGLLPVKDNEFVHPLNTAFIKAGKASGFPFNEDFNGNSQEGVGYFQSNILGGKRQSTARAFLYPAMKRKNLRIIKHAEAEKILIKNKKATGVRIRQKNNREDILANREVVICCGAINSPKLLLLSGIGPGHELNALNIKVEENLPGVGKNLEDHIQFFVGNKCTHPISLNSSLKLSNLYQYFFKKKGIMASAICSAGGFFKSNPNQSRPDLQFHFIPGIAGDDINDINAQPKYDGYMLGVTLLRPKSNGTVTLASKLPEDDPLIDPDFFSKEKDMTAMRSGYHKAMDVLSQKAFDEFRGEQVKPQKTLNSGFEITEFIRATTESVYHSTGTCKMGADELAVVNPELQIKNLERLRIVDASVFPTIPSGNINAVIIMVAEKAADLIKKSRRN
ncbi:MAG: GMC family oxidoreductase N-terminal domain-containing protein [Bacteroidota bacterium]